MVRFEYLYIRVINPIERPQDWQYRLDHFGQEGWQLVIMHYAMEHGGSYGYATFLRPVLEV